MPISVQDAHRRIEEAVKVTRADVVEAKGFWLSKLDGNNDTDVLAATLERASRIARWEPQVFRGDRGDTNDQVVTIARWISTALAAFVAADELAHQGSVCEGVNRGGWCPRLGFETSSGGCGMPEFKKFDVCFPLRLSPLPAWLEQLGDLFDPDLYIQRIGTVGHDGIKSALSMSLECFRRDLYVPAAAMLGAAVEGAWTEVGLEIARSAGDSALAERLASPRVSTGEKISKTYDAYRSLPSLIAVRDRAGVSPLEVWAAVEWSNIVRKSRNVLHWVGGIPSVPNSYQKVAVLLMAATGHLSALSRIRMACLELDGHV